MFHSLESLTRVAGDRSLEDALDEFGLSSGSCLLSIETAEGGVNIKCTECLYVHNVAEDSELSLVRDFRS
jgi:tRNA threonylcarbamoyladenosine modification (KEOPS) complex Cgi121 subunit